MNDIKIFLLLLALTVVSCQRMYEEDEEESSKPEQSLKVSARSGGESKISYPAFVYAFAEDGSCAGSQKMTDGESPIELDLPPAHYSIVAVAGLGEEYVMPENPKMDDVITMKGNNLSGRAMMLGSSSVTVAAGKTASVSVTLYYAVSLVNVILEDIPEDIKKVRIRISPLYSALSFKREYSGKDKSAEVECERETDGIWSAAPFYIFPGSGTQTILSITLEDDTESKTYGYTFTGGCPEANVPFNIGGSYSGNVTVEGSLISGEWKDPLEVNFNFGNSSGGSGNEGGGTSGNPSVPNPSGLPETGTIWQGGIVAGFANADSDGADVLLMSLDERTSLASAARNTVKDAEVDGWHIPTTAEAESLHAAFTGTALDELNEKLENLDGENPLIDIEKRYLYDNNGSIYAFGFKSTSKFQAAGKTVKYKIRLVRSIRCDVTP